MSGSHEEEYHISLDPKSLRAERKDRIISNHGQHVIKDTKCRASVKKRRIVLSCGMTGILEISLRGDRRCQEGIPGKGIARAQARDVGHVYVTSHLLCQGGN